MLYRFVCVSACVAACSSAGCDEGDGGEGDGRGGGGSDDPCDLSDPEPETWEDECFGTTIVLGEVSFAPIVATAHAQDPGNGYGPDTVVVFFEGGLLTAIGEQSCRYCNAAGGQPSPPRCTQSYSCGECWASFTTDLAGDLHVRISEADVDGIGGTPEATCPYLGYFAGEECVPVCDRSECGPDLCGGSCGDCADGERCRFGACETRPTGGGGGGNTACSECLASCDNLPGCCSGEGCMCESECMITDCPEGQFFCCSALGCICRTCPCYEWPCP